MNADELMAKAVQASASAELLLSAGDGDGAANRAYYAMFDAARAALLAMGSDAGKTHRGVLAAFADQFVRTGVFPREMGRLLKQAEAFRYVADYEGNAIEAQDAQRMVEHAKAFVNGIRAYLISPGKAG